MRYGWVLPYGDARTAAELAVLAERRSAAGLSMDGYDVVAEGTSDPAGGAATERSWADTGATWWLEADWSSTDPDAVLAAAEARLSAGHLAYRRKQPSPGGGGPHGWKGCRVQACGEGLPCPWSPLPAAAGVGGVAA
jgi:hypothetical protein